MGEHSLTDTAPVNVKFLNYLNDAIVELDLAAKMPADHVSSAALVSIANSMIAMNVVLHDIYTVISGDAATLSTKRRTAS